MFLWGLYEQHTSHCQFLRFNSKNKISICGGREYLFSGKTMILSLTYNKMPPPLLFRSSLWGTEKPFIKNWIDGKVLSNLVSDNIKISTYCSADIDSISNLLWMEFIFKWPIIERPGLPISERQDALGMRLYIWFFFCFSCIGSTLFKNSCSNETFVGVDSICLSFQPFRNQWNPNGVSSAFFLFNFV